MKLQENERSGPLEQLLELVEKAAATIERLQHENEKLARQVLQLDAVVNTATIQLQTQAERLQGLESTEKLLKEDAAWCRWFRQKYRDAAFFAHVERDFLAAHKHADDSGHTDAGSSNDTADRAVPPQLLTSA